MLENTVETFGSGFKSYFLRKKQKTFMYICFTTQLLIHSNKMSEYQNIPIEYQHMPNFRAAE